jgi:hypothetical protein
VMASAEAWSRSASGVVRALRWRSKQSDCPQYRGRGHCLPSSRLVLDAKWPH